jgi:hypothetical protein
MNPVDAVASAQAMMLASVLAGLSQAFWQGYRIGAVDSIPDEGCSSSSRSLSSLLGASAKGVDTRTPAILPAVSET